MRPSLEGFPEVLLPLLQSCWAEDPKLRPEFSEITKVLAKLLHNYRSTGISPEKKECPITSVQEPIPNYVEDKSEHAHEAQNLNTSVCTEGPSQIITQPSSPVLAQTKRKKTPKKCKGLWLCFMF